ncbi:MAG TPA: type VI secretion system contractile sheath large subunit [Gemmatimonadaceae bacterium]|nr:type VI secretion system contractile sheath large subunit [Gemmatimonadaceae bacterium]
MPDRDPFSQVSLDVRVGYGAGMPAPRPETPVHVALLGDFAGRGARDAAVPLARRRPIVVDRDDLDAALARLAPELELALGDGLPTVRARFTSLDDFHPDHLYARLPLFGELRDLRRRLADPATFAAAAAELGGGGASATSASSPPATPRAAGRPDPAGAAARLAGGSLLDEIVGAAGDAPAGVEQADDLASFIRAAVRPHLVPRPDPRQAELLASVDAATTSLLRLVLGHPAVRALEVLWRGLDLLVRRVETGSQLRLAILDVAREELAAAVAGDDPGVVAHDGSLATLLRDGAAAMPTAAPWSAIVGLYAFEATADDARLLDRLARVAAAAGAPWLSAAAASVAVAAGVEDGEDREDREDREDARDVEGMAAWRALRASPQARWLGLAWPALLLRLPYGEDGEPTDAVPFEELEAELPYAPAAARLLWGNAALVPALALTAAFAADGWEMRQGAHLDVERLPLHLHRGEGAVTAVPPGGRLLGEHDALRLLDAGIMPVLSHRDGDVVRLGRLQSVAEPPAVLAGRWAGTRA